MSEHAPGAMEPAADPAWDRFSAELKAQRAPLSAPPSPNDIARLVQRAEEAESRPPAWTRALVPAGALALVVAGVVAFVALRGEPEVPWSVTTVASVAATTSGRVTETAADGRALFVVGDDRLGVGPGSRVEVAAASSKATRVVLTRGSVAAHVDPSRGARSFDVETPQGTVHVVGTIFRVEAADDRLLVEVQRGVVEVSWSASRQKVAAGQRLVVTGGVPTLGPRPTEATFAELEESPPVAEVAPAVVPEPEPVAVDEPEPVDESPVSPGAPRKRGATAARLAEWRTRAARGECGLVMAEVKKALTGAPDDVAARLTLADCQRRSGDKQGAVESYLKAATGKGADANRATLMAASLLQDELNQPQRALKQLDRYLARGAESRDLEASALVRKARALQSMGKPDQARAVVELVLKKFADTSAGPEALRLRDGLR